MSPLQAFKVLNRQGKTAKQAGLDLLRLIHGSGNRPLNSNARIWTNGIHFRLNLKALRSSWSSPQHLQDPSPIPSFKSLLQRPPFRTTLRSSRASSSTSHWRKEESISLDEQILRGWLSNSAGNCIQRHGGGHDWHNQRLKLFSNNRFRGWSTVTTGNNIAEVQDRALSITIAGNAVPVVAAPGVSNSDVKNAVASNVFQQWIQSMAGEPNGILTLQSGGTPRYSLRQLTIQSVDYFCSESTVGFLKFKADVVDEVTGCKLPGIVFGRGGSVAVLVLLECEGVEYAVLVEQARVPSGRMLLELPSGMLDSDVGTVVGAAVREVEEETGIELRTSDLVDLTALLWEGAGRKRLVPSPGGSDEEIALFLYRGRVEKRVVEAMEGAETGLRDHGELIRTRVVPYSGLWRRTSDSMVLCAIGLYKMAKREGLLPPPPSTLKR